MLHCTIVQLSEVTNVASTAWAPRLPLLHAQGLLCVRQLLGRSERTHNALCYTVSVCSPYTANF